MPGSSPAHPARSTHLKPECAWRHSPVGCPPCQTRVQEYRPMRGVRRSSRAGRHSGRREVAGRAATIRAVAPPPLCSTRGRSGQSLERSRSPSSGADPWPAHLTAGATATSNISIKTNQLCPRGAGLSACGAFTLQGAGPHPLSFGKSCELRLGPPRFLGLSGRPRRRASCVESSRPAESLVNSVSRRHLGGRPIDRATRRSSPQSRSAGRPRLTNPFIITELRALQQE
jgi:hypothetical protein